MKDLSTSQSLLVASLVGFSLGALAQSLFSRKRRKRRSGDGLAASTEDLSLFYSSDIKSLTTVKDEYKRLPGDFYGKVVSILPILCIDLAIQRPSDGKFLIVKRASEPVKGFWWVPGGRIFRGETFYAAARRKAKEETGVEAEPLKVLGVWNTFFPTSAWDGDTHTINVAVHLRLKSDIVKLDETSDDHTWISVNEALVGQYDPYVQGILMAVKNGQAL